MQTLTRTNKVVVEDFYHLTTMNESVNRMKLTHLLLTFFFKSFGSLLYIYIYICVRTLLKQNTIPLPCEFFVH